MKSVCLGLGLLKLLIVLCVIPNISLVRQGKVSDMTYILA